MSARLSIGLVAFFSIVLILVLSGCGKKVPPVPTANCSDQIKNQNESAVDCGGPNCGKCVNDKVCLSSVDCLSNHCAGGVCQSLATCTDAVKNQDETDVDCGGKICHSCGMGKVCGGNTDCDSAYCSKGVCGTPPPTATCSDGVKNQDETDVDCGGSKCGKCASGRSCAVDGDCMTNTSCMSGKCQVDASCSDRVKSGQETDVDCGGSKCKKCVVGKACLANSDCFTNVCKDSKCQGAGTCRDLLKNQDESDVDCGGSKCQKCPPGRSCNGNEDCQSSYCGNGKCGSPPPKECLNTIKDGDETDVDCGGARCPQCKASQKCRLGSDCATGICASQLCQP